VREIRKSLEKPIPVAEPASVAPPIPTAPSVAVEKEKAQIVPPAPEPTAKQAMPTVNVEVAQTPAPEPSRLDSESETERVRNLIAPILRLVCDVFLMEPSDIEGKRRSQLIVDARHAYHMLAMEKVTNHSLLSRVLGVDHGSLIYVGKTFPVNLRQNTSLTLKFDECKRRLDAPADVPKADAQKPVDEVKAIKDGSGSSAAVAIGRSLNGSFTATDLAARLGNQQVANLWIADWKRCGWIDTCGFMQYRLTDRFGKGP
jgi:hypothetical protein